MARKGWEGKHFNSDAERFVGFKTLGFQALPELWTFQSVVGFVLAAVLGISNRITDILINSLGMAITSANWMQCLFTWQGVLLAAVWVVALPAVVAIELFAEISLCNDLLYGKPGRIIESLKNGMLSLKRFLTFRGVWTILYVLLAAPICGVGFSVSVTDELHIPHFIAEAIFATPLYRVAYFLLIAVLVAAGIIHVFVMHAVVIDGVTPSEARSWSLKTMRAKGFQVLGSMVLPFLFWFFLSLVVYVLLIGVPTVALEMMWPRVAGVELGVEDLLSGATLTSAQQELLTYRILAAFTVVCGSSLNGLMLMLSGSYLILRFTRCYDELAHGKRELWPARTRHHAYLKKIGFMIISVVFLAALSVGVGTFFDVLFYWDPVGVVGHRAAGTLAPENSLEGLEVAIEHGCYASEIDVQRTKDGRYVINHDDTFRRLAGDERAPKDMTFEEVRGLRPRDARSGETWQVPTLEEMLDAVKGRERLLVELKGATADRRMVDDVVAMARERDCVGDVILISLNYDVIEYAERTYPEFDTGTLVFVSVGNVSHLTCDYVLMEEELATDSRIAQVQNAGKYVGVWTVNTEAGIREFLSSRVDLIITDRIDLADKIQAELDKRSDLEIIQDVFGDVFG